MQTTAPAETNIHLKPPNLALETNTRVHTGLKHHDGDESFP
jgi:hypothetical protein